MQVVEGKTPARILCTASAHPGNLIAFQSWFIFCINLITFPLLCACIFVSLLNLAPKYRWKRLDTNEDLSSAQALTFSNGLNRTDKGVYSCIVENKHGSNVANITMNILCELYIFFYLAFRSHVDQSLTDSGAHFTPTCLFNGCWCHSRLSVLYIPENCFKNQHDIQHKFSTFRRGFYAIVIENVDLWLSTTHDAGK